LIALISWVLPLISTSWSLMNNFRSSLVIVDKISTWLKMRKLMNSKYFKIYLAIDNNPTPLSGLARSLH
jgi:hypothetical protein